MSEEINNYNRTFETKATQELKAQDDKLKTAGEKYQNFRQELQKELAQKDNTLQKDRFNDPVKTDEDKDKKKKKGFIFEFLDKIASKVNGKTEKTSITNNDPVEEDDITMLDKDMSIKDIVAPIDLEIDFNHIQMGDYYFKTFKVTGYPRIVGPNWLSPIINFEHSLRISTFYYPVESKDILEKLKRKIGEMEATLYSQMEDRKVVDPTLKVALSDAQQLQDSIAEGSEKYFHYGMYITIYAPNKELLEKYSRNVTSTFAAMNVIAKPATLQQDQGFISTQPLGLDKLYITRNMDTTSLATTFPFVTSELTMDKGIMYGINMHNKSLVIFDRFQLENANTVVFAKAGAGKSYFVKLEALRSLMLGTEVIIIDPEKEYQTLSDAVNGSYISFSQDKGSKMNPFELSGLTDDGDDELRMKLLTLHGFFKILFGGLSNVEESILDKALILTYREKGITFDPATQTKTPPLLEDMYKVLKGMAENEAHDLARRMEKYIIGSAAGIFNEASNFEIKNPFTVFSIRDLQEELKPLSMYLMLDFIWTKIRKDQRRRLLIVDEAWYMMLSLDSANFMYSIAKRARKYYLGLSTITQDVADFLNNDMGKAIISNSSMQILMKQSPSALDKLQAVFNLSDGEKNFLLSCDRGQGLFFAGANHVGIQVISSQAEHELITSDPKELEARKAQQGMTDTRPIEEMAQIYEPPAEQQVMNNVSAINRQQQVIMQAIDKRKEEQVQIEDERKQYQKELEARLRQQELELNPNKQKSQQTFLDEIKQKTISGQVIQSREDIQKGRSHITPQGPFASYNNPNEPRQQ
jgi:conjugal transfer ATP-binding protein TraC